MPAGYKVNPLAPYRFEWNGEGGVSVLFPKSAVVDPQFPIRFEATFREGSGLLTGDLSVVHERSGAGEQLPHRSGPGGGPDEGDGVGTSTVSIDYSIAVPDR